MSASFDEGELVWVSGPSGSGKSTLLGIASLLIPQSKGSVRVGGVLVPPGDEHARTAFRRDHFGIIPQSPRLFPELTSAQNVMLSSPNLTEADARDSLSRVGLGDTGSQPVKTMSGGEQQRVSIARAISKHPDFVFADELTSALDDENAHAVWKILREIVDGGVRLWSHPTTRAFWATRIVVSNSEEADASSHLPCWMASSGASAAI
ncbi:MAG: ATP-binding cassette domain-containing protein [Microbacterium sp.]